MRHTKAHDIYETPYFSYRLGQLPAGCRYCVKGTKGVLYITGLCERNCAFCPTSDEKKEKDVIFINEQKITEKTFAQQFEQVVAELKRQDAKGIGITGGNPLLRNTRTCRFIRSLKKLFGPSFHIHLYTSLTPVVTPHKLKELHTAGLDEIRFHPEIDTTRYWDLIRLATDSSFSWDIGVEIPVLPDKKQETEALVDFVSPHVTFLNFNELEMADNSFTDFMKLGYVCKDDSSYAIKDSVEFGIDLLERMRTEKMHPSGHVCTAALKNVVQLGKRIQRTALHTKLPSDRVTSDGLLKRGVLYHPDCTPSFSYTQKLRSMSRQQKQTIQNSLETIQKELQKSNPEYADHFTYQPDMLRILTHPTWVRQIGHSLSLTPAVVVEYPTADHFLVEVDFL